MSVELVTSYFSSLFLLLSQFRGRCSRRVGRGENYFYIIGCLFRLYCFFLGCMASLNWAQPVHDQKNSEKVKKVWYWWFGVRLIWVSRSLIVTRPSVFKHLFSPGTHHRRVPKIGYAPEQAINVLNRACRKYGPLEDTLLLNSNFW